ncbi:hypothetical protein CHLNCDRAFT_27401 [Chlorella variabilis]|uniref:Magnesium-dependent phosphatase-1 n=1 Tax=Chlorella variabilis TaxID=554065 RepID=E1ZQF5_CHLVA|nr:hypothetical protein CHLNCDRAFT_27401 [Chlorella variabilis]EFN51922.1 hypothetical protein CHLNCDRAFT_27401 [Chlorella variabilis]|eukprot:XP_005844024.1 hypothetical protein CHLNCDRAFT_27401 [Chlorella variabilis]
MDIRVAWQACPWPNSTQLQAGPSGLLLQVVFDLDYTLWPFWCEMFTAAQTPWLYPHVPAILEGLQARRIPLAVASRTPTPHVANAFINKLDIRHRFCRQAQPSRTCLLRASSQPGSCSCSCPHLPNIQCDTGLPFTDMLFFDDEHGNIKRVGRLGVVSILVDTSTGVCLQSLERGLQAFADAKQAALP